MKQIKFKGFEFTINWHWKYIALVHPFAGCYKEHILFLKPKLKYSSSYLPF